MGSTHAPRLIAWLPAAAFCCVWGAQGLYRALAEEALFPPLADQTLVAIAVAACLFLLGCLVASAAATAEEGPPAEGEAPDDVRAGGVAAEASGEGFTPALVRSEDAARRRYRWVRLAGLAAAVLVLWVGILAPLARSGLDLATLRNESLEGWAEGGLWSRVYAILLNWLACWLILLFNVRYQRERKPDLLVVAAFVIVSVAALSRTLLLIGYVSALVCVLAHTRRPVRLVLGTAMVFGVVFLGLALVMKPREDDASAVAAFELITAHLQVYLFGGPAGLDTFITTSTPTYPSFLTIPRFVQTALSMEPPPPFFEFVETPLPLNVFTSIYPPLHDFGLIGVAVYFFAFGAISTAVCRRFAAVGSPLSNIAAGFMVYATAMTVFDDQFIRGMPVLLIWLAGAALFQRFAGALLEGEAAPDPDAAEGARA